MMDLEDLQKTRNSLMDLLKIIDSVLKPKDPPSFYTFVRNMNKVAIDKGYNQKLPIMIFKEYCMNKDENLSEGWFIQYLEDLTKIFPKRIGVMRKSNLEESILIHEVRYSSIIIYEKLI